MSSSLVILFGVLKQFGRFWIWTETECKIPAEYGLQHNPPPPPDHTLSVYSVHLVWEGVEGGEVREKIEGQQYTSIVPSSMGGNSSQAGTKIPTNEWMYLQSIKSVKHNAANSVNRSILKKSRHQDPRKFKKSFRKVIKWNAVSVFIVKYSTGNLLIFCLSETWSRSSPEAEFVILTDLKIWRLERLTLGFLDLDPDTEREKAPGNSAFRFRDITDRWMLPPAVPYPGIDG